MQHSECKFSLSNGYNPNAHRVAISQSRVIRTEAKRQDREYVVLLGIKVVRYEFKVPIKERGRNMPLLIMAEAERLRRKELRRRPKMMEWARALGLFAEDDGWKVVVPHKSRRRMWGDET